MKYWSWVFALLLTGMLLTGCNGQEKEEKTAGEEKTAQGNNNSKGESQNKLQVMKKDKIGKYLTDSEGKALYYFAKDKPNTTNCSGKCLKNWPAFYSKDISVPQGFDKEDFDEITRKDNGEKQTTYKGYPLYYFAKDQAAGDVNGQGVKDIWFIVNSETKFTQ